MPLTDKNRPILWNIKQEKERSGRNQH